MLQLNAPGLLTLGTQWQLHLSLCCMRPCSAVWLRKVLLASRQHGLLCVSCKAVLNQLSSLVQWRHSPVQTPIAASCSAGMTEASPTCTMGGLKVCLLSHHVCRAERHKPVQEAPIKSDDTGLLSSADACSILYCSQLSQPWPRLQAQDAWLCSCSSPAGQPMCSCPCSSLTCALIRTATLLQGKPARSAHTQNDAAILTNTPAAKHVRAGACGNGMLHSGPDFALHTPLNSALRPPPPCIMSVGPCGLPALLRHSHSPSGCPLLAASTPAGHLQRSGNKICTHGWNWHCSQHVNQTRLHFVNAGHLWKADQGAGACCARTTGAPPCFCRHAHH